MAFPSRLSPRRLLALRALPLALSAVIATWLPHTTLAQTAILQYDIPAGPLAPALTRYAQEAGVDLVVDLQAVAGRQTQGLRGQHGIDPGFAQLLRGTGYRASRTTLGYVLEVAPNQATPVTTLDAVEVQGVIPSITTTEGSGSYAAQAITIAKGAQSLREIPQSISVVTRQQMDDQGSTTVADAMQYVTGMTASDYEGTEKFNARGFGTSVQYDGIPQQGSSPHQDLSFYDRVEVLRGPSGLLTGSGEPGGAINYVRKRPREAAHLSAAVSVGSWQHRRLEVDAGSPLNAEGTLRGRVVGTLENEHKFYDEGRNQPRNLYGVLTYDLTPDTTLGLSAAYRKRRFINFNGLPLYADGSLPARDDYVGPDKLSTFRSNEMGLDLTHQLSGGWTLKAAYQHRRTRYEGYSLFTSTMLDVATGRSGAQVGSIANRFRWDQGDVYVSGPFSLLGREHHLTLGYNYARDDNTTSSRFSSVPDIAPLQDHHFDALYALPILNRSQSITTQSGIYANGRLRLTPTVALVLGGRWTHYENKRRTVAPQTSDWTVGRDRTRSRFTPYGGLVWDITPTISVYASYTDIFVPQTQQDVSGATLAPRIGWQTEAGVKGEFFDGRMNATLAIFRIRDRNRAMVDSVNIGCGGTPTGACYTAAGEIQSQGWETEISGSPLPGWDITGGYTYTHAIYRQDANAALVGQRFGADVLPRHLFKLWTHYRFNPTQFNGALTGWRIGMGVHAQSDVYTSAIRQGGYATVGLQLGYQISPQWDASLAIHNLLNRNYLRTPGYGTFYNLYGAPRSAVLTLRYSL